MKKRPYLCVFSVGFIFGIPFLFFNSLGGMMITLMKALFGIDEARATFPLYAATFIILLAAFSLLINYLFYRTYKISYLKSNLYFMLGAILSLVLFVVLMAMAFSSFSPAL